MSVLVCENICKNQGKKEIVKNFSYNFLDNQIYAIIGKSNSAEDELLNVICGKTKASSGQVYLDGELLYNNREMNERLCYISQNTIFPKNIRVIEIFKIMQSYFPKWDNAYAYNLIQYFNIDVNSHFVSFNENTRALFVAIIGLASMANITVFNQPLDKIDSKDRYDYYNFLYTHHERYPRTFIITTDLIDEIDYLVNKVLFIDRGRLFAQFTIDEIKENFRYLSGKTEVLRSLISGVKILGIEDRGKNLSVCIRQKLSKDDVRKYQKYLIKISEVPIRNVYIYLMNIRETKEKSYVFD